MAYPFWLKNQADYASSDAMRSRKEADESKGKLHAIMNEINIYKTLESENITKEQLTQILDKISEILSK